jgi:large subunit ribosomal protein L32
MAVPKRKPSKARGRARRSINMRLAMPVFTECNTCGNKILPHKICPKCGFYKGKQYLELEEMS